MTSRSPRQRVAVVVGGFRNVHLFRKGLYRLRWRLRALAGGSSFCLVPDECGLCDDPEHSDLDRPFFFPNEGGGVVRPEAECCGPPSRSRTRDPAVDYDSCAWEIIFAEEEFVSPEIIVWESSPTSLPAGAKVPRDKSARVDLEDLAVEVQGVTTLERLRNPQWSDLELSVELLFAKRPPSSAKLESFTSVARASFGILCPPGGSVHSYLPVQFREPAYACMLQCTVHSVTISENNGLVGHESRKSRSDSSSVSSVDVDTAEVKLQMGREPPEEQNNGLREFVGRLRRAKLGYFTEPPRYSESSDWLSFVDILRSNPVLAIRHLRLDAGFDNQQALFASLFTPWVTGVSDDDGMPFVFDTAPVRDNKHCWPTFRLLESDGPEDDSTTTASTESSDTSTDGGDVERTGCHLLVCIPGLLGHGTDLLRAADELLARDDNPWAHLEVLLCSSTEGKTVNTSIQDLANLVAGEIAAYVERQSLEVRFLSIVAHSMGGLIAKAVFQLDEMRDLVREATPLTFLTLATPHDGIRPHGSFRGWLVNAGTTMFGWLTRSPSITELRRPEDDDDDLLARLSDVHLPFRNIVLCGSTDDTYCVAASACAEHGICNRERRSVLRRFEVSFSDAPSTLTEKITGRHHHLGFLESDGFTILFGIVFGPLFDTGTQKSFARASKLGGAAFSGSSVLADGPTGAARSSTLT
jgi:Putative serine esterase (DUF676)/Protein FAM135